MKDLETETEQSGRKHRSGTHNVKDRVQIRPGQLNEQPSNSGGLKLLEPLVGGEKGRI